VNGDPEGVAGVVIGEGAMAPHGKGSKVSIA